MPVEFIQWDLDAGRLVQLEVAEGPSFSAPLYVIRRGDEEPGPATRWVMQQFLDMDRRIAEEYGGKLQPTTVGGEHVPIHMPFHQRSTEKPSAATTPAITATPVKQAPAATSRQRR